MNILSPGIAHDQPDSCFRCRSTNICRRSIAALQSHSCLVLRAETGAGKTTRVPPALLDAGWLAKSKLCCFNRGGLLPERRRRGFRKNAARRWAI